MLKSPQSSESGADTPRERPRVTLIGPLPPLRGGIAQHTASLLLALTTRAETLALSYVRMYPARLFPGEGPHEPGDGGRSTGSQEVHFEIDALNPLTWPGTVRAAREHGSHLVVMPWWTVAVAPSTWAIARSCRRAGLPVTFVCHNVVDHDSAGWKRWVARIVLRQGERHVVASAAEAERLQALIPKGKILVHAHPAYVHFPPPRRSLPRRREREFLFFGLIRPYKGLGILLDAMSLIADDEWHLTIAGEPWEDLTALKRRVAESGIGDRVEWIERYVPAHEAAALFERADAVVLPYLEVTGCGVLALALGQGKPVVASDLPGLREQVVHGRTGWLVPAGDPDALAAALREVDRETAGGMVHAVRDMARASSWDSLAAAVMGHLGPAPSEPPVLRRPEGPVGGTG